MVVIMGQRDLLSTVMADDLKNKKRALKKKLQKLSPWLVSQGNTKSPS
jgi:hypothetical protein